jgi:hypothetical protein
MNLLLTAMTAFTCSLVVGQVVFNFIPPYEILILPSLVGFSLITYLLMASQYTVTKMDTVQLCGATIPETVFVYATFLSYYAFAAVFFALGLLIDYLAASFTVPVIMLILEIGSHRSILNYDIQNLYFVYSRTTFYATLRCSFKLLVSYNVLEARVVRLFPLIFSFLETAAMYIGKTTAYAFEARSVTFAAYAVVKAGVFLTLPLLEEAVLKNVRISPYQFDDPAT